MRSRNHVNSWARLVAALAAVGTVALWAVPASGQTQYYEAQWGEVQGMYLETNTEVQIYNGGDTPVEVTKLEFFTGAIGPNPTLTPDSAKGCAGS